MKNEDVQTSCGRKSSVCRSVENGGVEIIPTINEIASVKMQTGSRLSEI